MSEWLSTYIQEIELVVLDDSLARSGLDETRARREIVTTYAYGLAPQARTEVLRYFHI